MLTNCWTHAWRLTVSAGISLFPIVAAERSQPRIIYVNERRVIKHITTLRGGTAVTTRKCLHICEHVPGQPGRGGRGCDHFATFMHAAVGQKMNERNVLNNFQETMTKFWVILKRYNHFITVTASFFLFVSCTQPFFIIFWLFRANGQVEFLLTINVQPCLLLQ